MSDFPQSFWSRHLGEACQMHLITWIILDLSIVKGSSICVVVVPMYIYGRGILSQSISSFLFSCQPCWTINWLTWAKAVPYVNVPLSVIMLFWFVIIIGAMPSKSARYFYRRLRNPRFSNHMRIIGFADAIRVIYLIHNANFASQL